MGIIKNKTLSHTLRYLLKVRANMGVSRGWLQSAGVQVRRARGGAHVKPVKWDPSARLPPFSGYSRNAACGTWLLSPGISSS